MANAPEAIRRLWSDIEDKYNGPGQQDEELAGIVGDKNHSFGFHLSLNDLVALGEGGSDYSLQTARDKRGAHAHPDDASALDIHLGPQGMIAVTKRLIASAKDPNDSRLDCLYEFCGTTNGRNPHPYTVDTSTDDPNNTQGWDDSHVTHVHLSIHRDVCNDFDAIKAVADVIADAQEDIMDAKTIDEIATATASKMANWDFANDPKNPAPGEDPHPVARMYQVIDNTQAAVADLRTALAEQTDLLKKIAKKLGA